MKSLYQIKIYNNMIIHINKFKMDLEDTKMMEINNKFLHWKQNQLLKIELFKNQNYN